MDLNLDTKQLMRKLPPWLKPKRIVDDEGETRTIPSRGQVGVNYEFFYRYFVDFWGARVKINIVLGIGTKMLSFFFVLFQKPAVAIFFYFNFLCFRFPDFQKKLLIYRYMWYLIILLCFRRWPCTSSLACSSWASPWPCLSSGSRPTLSVPWSQWCRATSLVSQNKNRPCLKTCGLEKLWGICTLTLEDCSLNL